MYPDEDGGSDNAMKRIWVVVQCRRVNYANQFREVLVGGLALAQESE